MGGTAAAVTFPSVMLQGCKKAIQKASERTNVIWLQGQSCSGCSVSLLNKLDPMIDTVITEYISLNFHQTLMGGTGHTAVQVLKDAVEKNRKDFILIVEGSIPTKDDLYCTVGLSGLTHGRPVGIREWVEKLGANAKAVISVGACATFGGIPGAEIRATGDNPTGAKPVSEILKDKTIVNIGGCPPHPDWMVGTLLHVLLKGEVPPLDQYNRPMMYFGTTVHEKCERLPDYKRAKFAKRWGDEGCLYLLGCLGMDSGCDIPTRKWVDGANTCTGSGSGCIGCTEPPFPDYGNRGLYKHMQASMDDILKLEDPQVREAVLNLKKGGVING